MTRAQGQDSQSYGYRGPTAPPIPAPSWKHRVYIERPAELAELGRALASASIIAIDAEFVQARLRTPGEHTHRLMLVQFAMDDDYTTSYVVDALRLPNLSPLEAPLANTASLKLFHGVSADARVLATRGLVARHVLDLEAVSRSIFGQRESGLQAMLLRACGIRLDKSLQRADWARRPLTPAMIAYAARDAEMTFALYGWLKSKYGWAVALHEVPGDELPPPVASWILPFLENSRGHAADVAVLEAGIAGDHVAQESDLRAALEVLPRPSQRVRVLRLIADLNLNRLAPVVRPYLTSPAAEERAGALRTLGRLRDREAEAALRALLSDPVADVRQAAQLALDHLYLRPTPPRRLSPSGSGTWSIGPDESDDQPDADDWRSALRARFGIVNQPTAVSEPSDDEDEDDE